MPISPLPTIAQLPQTLDASPNLQADHLLRRGREQRRRSRAQGERRADAVRRRRHGRDRRRPLRQRQPVRGRPGRLGQDRRPAEQRQRSFRTDRRAATDEGRAMLENIHDIAPGAALAVRHRRTTASSRSQQQHPSPWPTRGSNVIVDDVGYADEPFFQDGLIAQGDQHRRRHRASPTSARRQHRRTRATSRTSARSAPPSASLGAGHLHELQSRRGSGGHAVADHRRARRPRPRIPPSSSSSSTSRSRTQQPASSTAAPTSEVDFYVLDATGTVVATGNNNNVATREPIQDVHGHRGGQLHGRDEGRQRAQPRPRRVPATSTRTSMSRSRSSSAAARRARSTRRRSATPRRSATSASAPCPGGRLPPFLNHEPARTPSRSARSGRS